MRKSLQIVLLLLVIAGVNHADLAGGRAGEQDVQNRAPVTIGVPVPLSGDLQAFGVMMKNSFELAKETINKKGGINGRRPLKVIYGDDKGEAAEGVRVVTRLVKESKAVMLVGGYSSSTTYYMAREADRLGVPFLICTASADKITQQGWKNVYRLNPPISEYTKGLQDFWIKNARPASMAIVYEESMFGTYGMRRMMEFCDKNAIEIRQLISYDKARAAPGYFRPLVALLTEDPPDVIYMVSYLNDAVELVKTIRELGIKSMLCGGAGGFTHQQFIKQAGKDANHVFTATLWFHNVPYPGAKEYFKRYVDRYSADPDYHGAEAYSALLVAADTLERAPFISPATIRAALNKTYMTTPFGPVKFYSYYDFERQNSVRTQVLQVIDGKFQCVWPPDLATAKFILPPK